MSLSQDRLPLSTDAPFTELGDTNSCAVVAERGAERGAERRACRLKPAFQAGASDPLGNVVPRPEPPLPGGVATCAARQFSRWGGVARAG